ncbi:MAG: nuclear transport factor 2 family protein [Bacteroidota bacterium]
MTPNQKIQLALDYIEAYNHMNVAGMMAPLSEDITFLNISDGQANMEIQGKEALQAQAKDTLALFTERQQSIRALQFEEANLLVIQIDYIATVAQDLPNGWKAGDKLKLEGLSRFSFQEGRISKIEDVS